MHEGHVAQERTDEDEARAPHDGTQRVEGQELRVGVASHARGDRNEGAHEGDETSDDERAATVVREVVLRLLQVRGLEDASVGLEEATPPLGAQEVADLRSDEGATTTRRMSVGRCRPRRSWSRPAVNNRDSPGSTGNRTPDSMRTMSIVPHSTHGPMATRSVSGFLNHSITVCSIDGSDAVTSVDQVTIGPFSAGNVSP